MKIHMIALVLFFLLFVTIKGKVNWEKMKKSAYSTTFPNIEPPIIEGMSNSKETNAAAKPKRDYQAHPKVYLISTLKQPLRKSDLLNGPPVPDDNDTLGHPENVYGPDGAPQGRSSIFGAVAGTAVSAVNAVGQTLRNWSGDGIVGRIGKKIQGIARKFGEIKFLLFTQKYAEYGELITLENAASSAFDRSKEVIFIVHGFTHASYYDKPQDNLISMLRIKDGFLKANFTSNIIIVDWTTLSSDGTYIFSSMSTATVADEISDFIIGLVTYGMVPDYTWVRLVGHSLGAHASGITGSKITKKTKGRKIARIDGLDPAGPNFDSYTDATLQISSDDAIFVHIIHSNIQLMGTVKNRGTVDFYPNGGDNQSGCDSQTIAKSKCHGTSCRKKRAVLGLDLDKHACNHIRCIDIYIESLTTEYRGCKCNSWKDFQIGACTCQSYEQPYMGYYCDENARGMFFLNAPLKSEYEKRPEAYVTFFNNYAGVLEQRLLDNGLLPEELKEEAQKRKQMLEAAALQQPLPNPEVTGQTPSTGASPPPSSLPNADFSQPSVSPTGNAPGPSR